MAVSVPLMWTATSKPQSTESTNVKSTSVRSIVGGAAPAVAATASTAPIDATATITLNPTVRRLVIAPPLEDVNKRTSGVSLVHGSRRVNRATDDQRLTT